jgi:hypothetical protein
MARGRTARKERVPFGVHRKKLDPHPDLKARLDADDKVSYWFNDVDHGSRIQAAQDAGYEFVTAEGYEKLGDANEKQEKGKKIKKLVGANKDGSPMYAFLMAIKRKWYEEDQAKKARENDRVDEAILGGNTPGVQGHGVKSSYGGTYKKNISIK